MMLVLLCHCFADLMGGGASLTYSFSPTSGTTRCQDLSTTDDTDFEGEETFIGSLSTASSLVEDTTNIAMFSIFDPEGELGLSV